MPCRVASGSGSRATAWPRRRIASTWPRMPSRASALITGPTSIESRSGLPTSSSAHRALQHGERAVGDILLQAEHAQRRAALAGAVEGGGDDVADHLLGERRGIDHQRVLPAGLGDQRDGLAVGLSRSASWRWISRATSVEPVNITPWTRAIGDQRRADLAGAGQELQGCRRDAGLVQHAHGLGGDQRRLLGRLGQHRVAGGKRRGDLAGEDRQREVPRADADDRARAAAGCRCRASRSDLRRRSSAGNRPPRAPRRWRWRRTCRPRARSGRAERASALSISVGGAQQAGGALARRRSRPRPARRPRRAPGRHRSRPAVASVTCADDVAVVGRVERPAAGSSPVCGAVGQQAGRPGSGSSRARRARCGERGEALLVGQIEAGGVGPLGAVTGRAAGRSLGCGAPTGLDGSATATGSAISSSIGTLGSAMRLTKEELAPFSSSRRTR